MIVKVAPLGERVVEVNVESGTLVSQILEIADVATDNRTIRVNNVDANLDTPVTAENAIITLAARMKGGR